MKVIQNNHGTLHVTVLKFRKLEISLDLHRFGSHGMVQWIVVVDVPGSWLRRVRNDTYPDWRKVTK